MLSRHRHWDALLAEFLHARMRTPFAFGQQDCCLFAADAILAMTGTDIAEGFRGYTSARGALGSIKRVTGGSGVEAALDYCATKYAMPECQPLMAGRGNLLLVEDNSLIAGIVGLDGWAWCAGENGLHRLPIRAAKKAWNLNG